VCECGYLTDYEVICGAFRLPNACIYASKPNNKSMLHAGGRCKKLQIAIIRMKIRLFLLTDCEKGDYQIGADIFIVDGYRADDS
jgi:hypothetical protein